MKRPQNEAFRFALKLISIKDRTESEIRNRLEKKGFSEAVIFETIEKLKEKGFIDDKKFIKKAEKIAEDRFIGETGLKYYLTKRGINKELLNELPQIDEILIAQRLLDRKEHFLKDIPEDKKKAKIVGFLLRRGFSWDTVNNFINKKDKYKRDFESQYNE